MSKGRTISAWILVAVLAALFIMAALGKLTGKSLPMFAGWGYPVWFAYTIGVLEILSAIGLLIPRTTTYAIFGLTAIMLGAAYTHLAAGEGLAVLRPIIFLGGLWGIWFLRRSAST